MSDLKDPSSSLLFISVLFNKDLIKREKISEDLQNEFGSYIEYDNDFFPMKEYYSKEMGEEANLCRYFLFFKEKIPRSKLVNAKIFCDSFEKKHLKNDKRVVNTDPGLVTLDQTILSTGKPYSHRIYLDKGVYAELTYRYESNSFSSLPWTYPDYQHPEIVQTFNWARNLLFI